MDLDAALGNKPIMVVAHPDDETLWGGGIVCRFPDKEWEILCCSIPIADPERLMKFFDACAVLGAIYRVLPYSEGGASVPLMHLDLINLDGFSSVVTHNRWGEYGHLHHKQVHSHVLSNWHGKLITFGYRLDGRGSEEVILNSREIEKKMTALECYNHKLLYEGLMMPKYQALIKRYVNEGGVHLDRETYDVAN